MTKENKFKALYILAVGLLVSLSIFVFQKVQNAVAKGLESSKKIRIAEKSSFCEEQNEAYFSGCNNVL